jgi:ribosomal protein S12 methylthiotransferase
LLWQARLATQAPEIDGLCYVNDLGGGEPRVGEMRSLRVTEAHDYDLVGELVDNPEQGYRPQSLSSPFHILSSSAEIHASR